MDNYPLKVFGAIWLMAVVTVLTIFTMCKIGGAWFNMPPDHNKAISSQERMYDHCLDETNGHDTNNCAAVLGVKK